MLKCIINNVLIRIVYLNILNLWNKWHANPGLVKKKCVNMQNRTKHTCGQKVTEWILHSWGADYLLNTIRTISWARFIFSCSMKTSVKEVCQGYQLLRGGGFVNVMMDCWHIFHLPPFKHKPHVLYGNGSWLPLGSLQYVLHIWVAYHKQALSLCKITW